MLHGNRTAVSHEGGFSFIWIHQSVEGEMILAVCLWAALEIWTIADLYQNKNKIWVNKIFAKQRSQDSLVQPSGNPTPISAIKAGRASFPSALTMPLLEMFVNFLPLRIKLANCRHFFGVIISCWCLGRSVLSVPSTYHIYFYYYFSTQYNKLFSHISGHSSAR